MKDGFSQGGVHWRVTAQSVGSIISESRHMHKFSANQNDML